MKNNINSIELEFFNIMKHMKKKAAMENLEAWQKALEEVTEVSKNVGTELKQLIEAIKDPASKLIAKAREKGNKKVLEEMNEAVTEGISEKVTKEVAEEMSEKVTKEVAEEATEKAIKEVGEEVIEEGVGSGAKLVGKNLPVVGIGFSGYDTIKYGLQFIYGIYKLSKVFYMTSDVGLTWSQILDPKSIRSKIKEYKDDPEKLVILAKISAYTMYILSNIVEVCGSGIDFIKDVVMAIADIGTFGVATVIDIALSLIIASAKAYASNSVSREFKVNLEKIVKVINIQIKRLEADSEAALI